MYLALEVKKLPLTHKIKHVTKKKTKMKANKERKEEVVVTVTVVES